jgi:HAD superfamily phosphoserine phosphatase-like hydrolase
LTFASVVLDVDSTLTSIEGISWLAERRGPDVARAVDAMTERAMEGATPLEAVYGERLALVRPSRADLGALAGAYAAGLVPGVQLALDALRAADVRLVVVSGGLRDAVVPFVAALGIAENDVYAVTLRFAPDGTYAGFDASSPLACRRGKPAIARTLGLPRPVLALGDGSTDAELKECVDAFAAFTGVVRRESVVAAADYVVSQFVDLPPLVL